VGDRDNPDYKILVVDDEPDLERLVRQRMRRQIRRGKYGFEFAGNGVEALEVLAEKQDIDIVLSDINMPKMDGLTLLQQIPEVNSDLRSVIVSAYGDMENIRTAMNRGAFDFVTKPIDFTDLEVTIERTLRHLDEWRAALVVGFLGAFTTFSTFSMDTLLLVQQGEYARAGMNVVLSVVLCLAGCWLGMAAARQF